MSPKAMKKLGITFLIIGISCYVAAFTVWAAIGFSMFSSNFENAGYLVILFAALCFLSSTAYISIPLLIMSHIRNKREQRKAATFCPYCGTKRQPDSKYCASCGNKLT